MESHLRLNDSINKTMAAQSTRNETLPEKLESQLQPLTSLIGDNFERMSAKHSENQQSIRSLSHSLSSLASHVSQLLERANLADTNTDDEAGFERSPRAHKQYKRTRQTSEWTCDSLSGIDDGFQESPGFSRCRYCSEVFKTQSEQMSITELAYQKGRHPADDHSFGKCNLSLSYSSWEDLKTHLDAFHDYYVSSEATQDDRFWRDHRPIELFRGDKSDDCDEHDHQIPFF